MSKDTERPISAGQQHSLGIALTALILDCAFVLIFAASGRSQHGQIATLLGLWQTAWPFLTALGTVWIFAVVWRRPIAVLRSGLPVWLGTVALGMLLRVFFTDGGAALPFVLVATGTLGVMLIGWRLIAMLIGKLRKN